MVVAEAEIAGFGASGGTVRGAHGPEHLDGPAREAPAARTRPAGPSRRRTTRSTRWAGSPRPRPIDVGYHRGGELLVARGPHQVPAIEEAYREYEAFGFADRYRLLDAAAAIAERVRIAGAVRGLTTPDAAVVHPGRRAAWRDWSSGSAGGSWSGHRSRRGPSGSTVRRPRRSLRTPTGDIHADTLVLAGEAYLPGSGASTATIPSTR